MTEENKNKLTMLEIKILLNQLNIAYEKEDKLATFKRILGHLTNFTNRLTEKVG